jgi:hypothetical protein
VPSSVLYDALGEEVHCAAKVFDGYSAIAGTFSKLSPPSIFV